MPTKPTTVAEYLASLPADRSKAIRTIRAGIRKNLPKGYEEGLQYGMLGFFVPHLRYPHGYHCDPGQPVPFLSVASQKNHIGLYLFCVYMDTDLQEWFVKSWKATGKKLDMGKACVRVKHVDDIPMEVLGELVRRCPVDAFIEQYESKLPASIKAKRGVAPAKAAGSKKKAAKKATKKSGAKKLTKKAASKKVAANAVTKKVSKKAAKKTAKEATTKASAKRAAK